MGIELPKDAEGCEIPLDTVVLFDPYGKPVNIVRWAYTTDFNLKDDWVNSWRAINEDLDGLEPELMYLNPPDSWEKLEEDMTRAINAPKPYNYDSMTCGYFDNAGSSCQECKKKNGFDSFNCNTVAWKDILSRIRKLRGKDE